MVKKPPQHRAAFSDAISGFKPDIYLSNCFWPEILVTLSLYFICAVLYSSLRSLVRPSQRTQRMNSQSSFSLHPLPISFLVLPLYVQ